MVTGLSVSEDSALGTSLESRPTLLYGGAYTSEALQLALAAIGDLPRYIRRIVTAIHLHAESYEAQTSYDIDLSDSKVDLGSIIQNVPFPIAEAQRDVLWDNHDVELDGKPIPVLTRAEGIELTRLLIRILSEECF